MLLKNNNDGNCLQKSSTEKNKIAAIYMKVQCYSDLAVHICKMQFHWSSWMEWGESTNRHLEYKWHHILCFISHSYTISPTYYQVLVILNSSPTSLPTGMAFLCFSRPPGCPGCAKDHAVQS